MKTKIEIKSVFGKLLFEYEKENNNIKDTLIEAIKSDADLGGADLRGAYLRGAYLSDADLRGANLSGAYLGGAYLGDADLGDWGKLTTTRDLLIIGPIGSRQDYTTIYHTPNGIFVACGCFRGNIDEFAEAVKKTHADNQHAHDYTALIDFVKKYYTEKSE